MSDVERIKAINLGDPVTNICAGEAGKHGYFMEYKVKSRRNKWGIVHKERNARCQFNKKTGDYGLDVIYAGHLDKVTCDELFKPVWNKRFKPNKQLVTD